MAKLVDKGDKIKCDSFKNDTLTFEELQNLNKVKDDMLKGDYCTFNEVFDEV